MSAPATAARRSYRERLLTPLLTQLKTGATSQGLSRSVAVAFPLAIFPFMGVTSLFCWLAGTVLKLNHIAMQVTNQLLTLVHLAMIPIYIRLGETWFKLPEHSFSPEEIVAHLKSEPESFLLHYGEAFLGAFGAWLITAPFLAVIIYPLAILVFRRIIKTQHTSK